MKKRDYNKIMKISIVIFAFAFFFMTLGFFVSIVYARDGWNPMPWFLLAVLFYIPSLSGMYWSNKIKSKERAEALKID